MALFFKWNRIYCWSAWNHHLLTRILQERTDVWILLHLSNKRTLQMFEYYYVSYEIMPLHIFGCFQKLQTKCAFFRYLNKYCYKIPTKNAHFRHVKMACAYNKNTLSAIWVSLYASYKTCLFIMLDIVIHIQQKNIFFHFWILLHTSKKVCVFFINMIIAMLQYEYWSGEPLKYCCQLKKLQSNTF